MRRESQGWLTRWQAPRPPSAACRGNRPHRALRRGYSAFDPVVYPVIAGRTSEACKPAQFLATSVLRSFIVRTPRRYSHNPSPRYMRRGSCSRRCRFRHRNRSLERVIAVIRRLDDHKPRLKSDAADRPVVNTIADIRAHTGLPGDLIPGDVVVRDP